MNIKLLSKNQISYSRVYSENYTHDDFVVYVHDENKFEVIKCRSTLIVVSGAILNRQEFSLIITKIMTDFIERSTEDDKKTNKRTDV